MDGMTVQTSVLAVGSAMTNAPDKELISFFESIGFRYNDYKYYKNFTMNEGTCELTVDGAIRVKQALTTLSEKRASEAVQAFGEKVLKEQEEVTRGVPGKKYAGYRDSAVPVSAITSLMEKEL